MTLCLPHHNQKTAWAKAKKEKEMTEKELLYELNELAEDILTPTDLLQSHKLLYKSNSNR